MNRIGVLIALLVAACAPPVRMPPEAVQRHRQDILALAADGKTKEAWEQYVELINTSGVAQYPAVLLQLATRVLERGFAAPGVEVREQAVRALQYCDHEFAFTAAAGRLEDEDTTVRAAAVDVLRKLGRPAAAKLIRPQLKPPAPEDKEFLLTEGLRALESLQMHAMWALAELGEKSLPVAPAVKGMTGPDPHIRAVGARALGAMGNPEALPSLRYGLDEDIEWEVNSASAEALLKLGRRGIVESFAGRVSRSDYPEKVVWSINMRRSHALGPTVDWIWREATYNASAEVRMRAAVCLGEMEVHDAAPRLIEMTEHLEPLVKAAAAYALAMLRDRSKIGIIVEATGSRDPEARARAVEYLTALDGERYLGIFRSLEEDPDPRVRLAAVLAFRPGGGLPPQMAFQYLAWPLGDENDEVRFTAAALIRKARHAGIAPPAEPVRTGN